MQSEDRQLNWYFFGHHRCGTTWMRDVIRKCCVAINANYFEVTADGKISSRDIFKGQENVFRPHTFTCYHNSRIADINKMKKGSRGFHLIRDPRDVLVSDYYSRKYSHSISLPWHQELRDKLHDLSLDDGLIYMLNQPGYLGQIKNWAPGINKHVIDIRYEDILENEMAIFTEIMKFLNVPVSEDILSVIVEECSFRNIARRHPGEENIHSHRRKAVAGDWRNYFEKDGQLKKSIYKVLEPVIVQLGYKL
jgi:hypothetical protein